MRLGQLARKLNLRTDEIVALLASKGITIESGNNTKLQDEHAQLVTQHFSPGTTLTEEEMSERPEQRPDPARSDQKEEQSEVKAEAVPTDVTEEGALTEVIRAPKVELAGLRVLGKIELPEKKKKETENTENPSAEPEGQQSAAPENSPRRSPRRWEERPRKEQSRKNPVALQREREQEEARRKREAQLEQQKERKKEYYLSRVKTGAPTKPARIHKEEVEEMAPLPEERPKTIWGRFMKWLNS